MSELFQISLEQGFVVDWANEKCICLARKRINPEEEYSMLLSHSGQLLAIEDYIGQPTKDGLISFSDQGKWGFLTSDGKVKIDSIYQFVDDYSCGLALVFREKNGNEQFINTKGEVIIELGRDKAESFKGGFSVVTLHNKEKKIIDTKGKEAYRVGKGYSVQNLEVDGMLMLKKKNGKTYKLITVA